jgi:hypothetical protein
MRWNRIGYLEWRRALEHRYRVRRGIKIRHLDGKVSNSGGWFRKPPRHWKNEGPEEAREDRERLDELKDRFEGSRESGRPMRKPAPGAPAYHDEGE